MYHGIFGAQNTVVQCTVVHFTVHYTVHFLMGIFKSAIGPWYKLELVANACNFVVIMLISVNQVFIKKREPPTDNVHFEANLLRNEESGHV